MREGRGECGRDGMVELERNVGSGLRQASTSYGEREDVQYGSQRVR